MPAPTRRTSSSPRLHARRRAKLVVGGAAYVRPGSIVHIAAPDQEPHHTDRHERQERNQRSSSKRKRLVLQLDHMVAGWDRDALKQEVGAIQMRRMPINIAMPARIGVHAEH